jgi:hypothetical protein
MNNTEEQSKPGSGDGPSWQRELRCKGLEAGQSMVHAQKWKGEKNQMLTLARVQGSKGGGMVRFTGKKSKSWVQVMKSLSAILRSHSHF